MKEGDYVILKFEHIKPPIMVVRYVEKVPQKMLEEDPFLEDDITCFWFSKDNIYQEKVFNKVNLEIVTYKESEYTDKEIEDSVY